MKHALALLILLVASATTVAGTGPDLSAWAPPDCQLVLEIQRLDEAMAPLAVSGPAPDPAVLIQRLWPELRLPWAPAEWPATGPDDWRSMSALVAAHRSAGAPAESTRGLLVVGFGTVDLYQRFVRQLLPPAETVVSSRTIGPYSVYSAPESAGCLVFGAQTVAFGRGFDVAGLITRPRSQVVAAESNGPALPGFPAESFLRLRLNLASMGLLSDDTMRAAAERIVQELRQPAEAPDAGGAPISAFRNLFSRITPAQMTAFLTGLGLDSLRDLTLTLSGDAERVGLAMDLAIDREPGLVQDYLGGMRDRQPVAWRLLPADTLMAMDSILDASHLLRLLRAHARDTLGTSGETVFLGLELAAQARLGLSFSDRLLPLLGAEWGLAALPGAPGEPPRLVGFCVPEDPALLAVVLERLAPRLPLGVTPPAPGGEPFYILNLNPQTETPSLAYLLQTGPAIFVSDRPEALRQILAASRSGATFNPSVLQDPPAGVRRIQMLYGRADLPGAFGRSAPASGVPFLGQTCLSDSGLSAGFILPRSALAGLVQLLPGLLARVPLSPASETDGASPPDAAPPRP
ncbi:MAG TPA: hypothetical protein PLY66_02675 [Acidobacteriota bacterium]|nr:hypothetical protein [Acidobacteriota bacterium]HQF85915.1 hypothetical protein [Acidobacteriota bacterium]HQG90841.1 hypothetical protein [Acidobacteriota bacterium]HQK86617.1 hypothetical protein [Acidobacteriota bacterium]